MESHWSALPSPSSLGGANQSRFPLLTSVDLARTLPRTCPRFGGIGRGLCFPTGVKRWEAVSL